MCISIIPYRPIPVIAIVEYPYLQPLLESIRSAIGFLRESISSLQLESGSYASSHWLEPGGVMFAFWSLQSNPRNILSLRCFRFFTASSCDSKRIYSLNVLQVLFPSWRSSQPREPYFHLHHSIQSINLPYPVPYPRALPPCLTTAAPDDSSLNHSKQYLQYAICTRSSRKPRIEISQPHDPRNHSPATASQTCRTLHPGRGIIFPHLGPAPWNLSLSPAFHFPSAQCTNASRFSLVSFSLPAIRVSSRISSVFIWPFRDTRTCPSPLK